MERWRGEEGCERSRRISEQRDGERLRYGLNANAAPPYCLFLRIILKRIARRDELRFAQQATGFFSEAGEEKIFCQRQLRVRRGQAVVIFHPCLGA